MHAYTHSSIHTCIHTCTPTNVHAKNPHIYEHTFEARGLGRCGMQFVFIRKKHTATHCNTLQHTATHCNTLQYTAIHCNTLQHTATHCHTLQHTATHCSSLQHTAAHCNTLHYTATRMYASQTNTMVCVCIYVYISLLTCIQIYTPTRAGMHVCIHAYTHIVTSAVGPIHVLSLCKRV